MLAQFVSVQILKNSHLEEILETCIWRISNFGCYDWFVIELYRNIAFVGASHENLPQSNK
jgi:hypothetical protein